ncbi:MAG: DUF2116 family Zn-ribbon domain-containing protein [Methanobrevibacter sp.]|jgi:NADH:ubiquinone oxidoreductase subunit 3 (subunit A)|nr:DUF2116 family Zn-ribbon domain-containing protein [Candidatus Methanoflexus mossambicus]
MKQKNLNLKFCEKCGSPLKHGDKFCENCGEELFSSNNNGMNFKKYLPYIMIVIIIVLLVVGVTIFLFSSSPNIGLNNTENSQLLDYNSGFPVSEVNGLAKEVNNQYPDADFTSITYKGITLDKEQIFYIFAKAIVMKDNNENSNIPINYYSPPDDSYGYLNSATLTKSDYVDMADRTAKWMDSAGRVPNYIGIYTAGVPDLDYDNTFELFLEVWLQSNGDLPSSISI